MNARFLVPLLSFALACWVTPLAAQRFPSKPIRIIVPSMPGGAIDTTTRTITPKLADALGQPVFVENRPGADTMLGTEMAARAVPDGTTLISVFDNFPLSPYLFKKVPYDPIKDFKPISLIIRGPMIVGVPPQLGVKDLPQFLQLARSNPGKLNYASAGAGTSSHLTVELFKLTTGIDVQAVHYKAAAPAVTDLVGGHVQLMIAAFGTLLQQVRSGKLVALAVSAPKKVPQLRDVPTIAEFYPGFEAQSWVGMLAPAGTADEIIRRLNAEVVKTLSDPEVRSRFENQAYEVVASSPEGFARWIAEQSEKWGRVIRERKITLQ